MIKKILWVILAFVVIGMLFGYFVGQIAGTESEIILHNKRIEQY
jgi:uncharacterized membrane protein YpjA